MRTLMRMTRLQLLGAIGLIIAIPLTVWIIMVQMNLLPEPGKPLFPPFNLSDRLSQLTIEEDGEAMKVVYGEGDDRQELSGDEFLKIVNERKSDNKGVHWLFNALDITSWASIFWVLFGFIAQAVFMGRLLLQWIATEKAKSSVVPVGFWWLSLVGSTMLMIYFTWRKDPVGIAGQCTGWFVYVRNLFYIYEKHRVKN